MSFQLVSPTSLHDRAKTMIEFEAEYNGKPLVCSISRRVLEQLGNRNDASTEELLKLFEEHRPTIAAAAPSSRIVLTSGGRRSGRSRRPSSENSSSVGSAWG